MPRQPDASDTPELQIEPIWEISTTSRAKAFVDFQNDVTSSDLKLAVRENYASVEHAKRYTTAGMATDQGKISNTNVIGLIAKELSVEPGSVGTTTYRPPYSPISFGAIAGSHNGPLILPLRTTPITQWHIDSGASMNEAGSNFRRPFYYPGPGEDMRSAVNREALAVRENVGIYDGTPLGKFELHGPDVTTFLNRVYTNSWDDLEIGQGRFGLMLHEDGRLLDDGVTFRLGENHYLLSAGSGTADAVYTHMVRLLQVVWPNLRVYVTTVTAQWVNICVCGPKAREVLASTGIDINLDANSFPFMSMREGQVAGKFSRVARVSYTGELSFEVNVRRRDGLAVWEALMDAGAAFGITPVGSETSGVLRIEKGYISAGAEGDGITNPFDAGMSWVVNMKKSDFVGKRSLVRDQSVDGLRQQVVGLLPQDEQFVMAEGSAIIEPKAVGEIPGFLGHVTASCFSPNLDRSISLALLKNGRDRHGDTVTVSGLDRTIEALVVPPVFIDAKGERMRS
jgi:sarcosine oxidase subunit alpha